MRTPKIQSLKRGARLILQEKFSFLALITMMMAFCNLMLSYLSAFAVPVIDNPFSLILDLLSMVAVNMIYTILLAGAYRLYLNIAQNRPCHFQDLTSAFFDHPDPIAAYSVISLLIQYGALTLVLRLHRLSGSIFLFSAAAAVLGILVVWFRLTFAAVLFLHADNPGRSFARLMNDSAALMRGHRMKFLLLQLSFIGVFLLGILSFGIGLLFVIPYRTMTSVLFFMELRNRHRADDDSTASEI